MRCARSLAVLIKETTLVSSRQQQQQQHGTHSTKGQRINIMTVESPASAESSPRSSSSRRNNSGNGRWLKVTTTVLLTISLATLYVQLHATTPLENHPLSPLPKGGMTAVVVNENNSTTTSQSTTTFSAAISSRRRIDWKTYDRIVAAHDEPGLVAFARQVYVVAFEFAIQEPHTPINHTCQPPPPIVVTDCAATASSDHTKNNNILMGRRRPKPARVGHAIQLGFDIDTLEILLRELSAVVDWFFVVEWTMPHNKRLHPKPLAWEAVKHQHRFDFVRQQVVHIVLDDVDAAYTTRRDDLWTVERLQEQRRWEKIVEWNAQTGYFGDDDLIGFGDTDEIPSRRVVELLKNCQWRNDKPVDVGIWFPMGRINQAFRTDQPIRGHPYTLGDPTFHVWKSAMRQKHKTPSRNRGTSGNFILGGAHFSNYGYLISQILKGMSCTECDYANLQKRLAHLRAAVQSGEWQQLEQASSQMQANWAARTIALDQLDPAERDRIVYLPWFYDCNRDRYSMWEGRPDSRIV